MRTFSHPADSVIGMRLQSACRLFLVAVLAGSGSAPVILAGTGREPATKVSAPLLQRNEANPRYFADPGGNAVYVTGSHTWNNLLDKGAGEPPEPFDWGFYLDFLRAHNHNFIRLWSGQTIHNPSRDPFGAGGATPLPWKRTGPGEASDGRPRFDLTQFNEAYFERLRHRVRTAGERGIYVDIMLFEGFCVSIRKGEEKPLRGHVFAGGNNINGVDITLSPRDGVFAGWVTLDMPEVVRLQELYVRKLVEAVNEFDNVIYEVANEPGPVSHEWQEHFVKFVRALEADMPKQHLIGVPGGMKTSNRKSWASSADWVSPDIQSPDDPHRTRYMEGTATWGEPDYDGGDKVVILDTDHLWGLGGNVVWAWQSFCRGYNVIYMDPASDWPGAFFAGTKRWSNVPNLDLRREMGVIRAYAGLVDLNRSLPRNELSSTGYCLANPGKSYICFQPEPGAFTVSVEPGRYAVEWHFPETGETTAGRAIEVTTGTGTFTAPRAEPAVLFLRRLGDAATAR